MMENDEAAFVAGYQPPRIPKETIDASITMATEVMNQVLQFVKTDHYNQLSTRVRYTPVKGDGYWYPTPPAYLEPVEPNWKTVRPLMLDSCSQFAPAPPTPFSKDSSSEFFALAKEVYEYGQHPTADELAVSFVLGLQPVCGRNSRAHVHRV